MMLEKPSLRLHIERILGRSMKHVSISTSLWTEWTQSTKTHNQKSSFDLVVLHQHEGSWFLLWKFGSETVDLLQLEDGGLNQQEQQWVELVLLMEHQQHQKISMNQIPLSDEQQAIQLGQWIVSCMQERDWKAEMPEHFPWKRQLSGTLTPFLMVTDHVHGEGPRYKLLKKLVSSYFQGDTFLVPLSEQEWLILVPQSLTSPDPDDDSDSKESPEELLTSYCLGLYELLIAEWIGESHLTVDCAFTASKGIPAMAAHMREMIFLGRTFHVAEHIHLPWELHLEQLVYSIPDEVRTDFIRRIVGKTDIFSDTETMATLEMFFQQNCSVSETAKRLYIHRNTLLYRLDKIKQETGLDVRSFSDAVLVKLVLLMYRVIHA